MSRCFKSADLLLPKKGFDKWSVIACDQHTSDIAYWQSIREEIDGAPSTLNLILPEAELHLLSDDVIDKIAFGNVARVIKESMKPGEVQF